MKKVKIFSFLLLLVLFYAGCKKDSHDNGTSAFLPPAVQDIAMYEINLRAFSTEGTFNGILPRLDTLAALGINCVWLMPIYPVGQVNSAGGLGSPYSVKNYKEVNPEFGTFADFNNLVAQCHKKGMAVILDWVANHTAWDNPWITEHKDWYTQDSAGNIVCPPGTNWTDVADLNYSNAGMRLAMIDAMKYWVNNTSIDGFRCDAADMVPFDFWKQAIDSLKNIKNRDLILLAEGSRTDHFTAGFQMNFAWDFYNKVKNVFTQSASASGIYSTCISENTALPLGAYKLRFTTNHDETAWDNPPVAIFGGVQGALAASVITIFMGGVPLLYTGQEVGTPVKTPFFTKQPIDWTLNPGMASEYRRLMDLRNNSWAVKAGTFDNYSSASVAVFKRTYGSDHFLVIVNTRNATVSYTVPAALDNTHWVDTYDYAPTMLSGNLSLQPYQYMILKQKDI